MYDPNKQDSKKEREIGTITESCYLWIRPWGTWQSEKELSQCRHAEISLCRREELDVGSRSCSRGWLQRRSVDTGDRAAVRMM